MTMSTTAPAAIGCEANLAERWRSDWLLGHPRRIGALLIASIALAIAIMAGVWMFETSSSPAEQTFQRWPADTSLSRSAGRQTLLLFAHPKCPCTSASLEAIAQIAKEHEALVDTQVVFSRPTIADESWRDSPLCQTARANESLHVRFDDDAIEARRFAVKGSGKALLFAADGTLLFAGSVTAPPGKTQKNAGQTSLLEKLQASSRNATCALP